MDVVKERGTGISFQEIETQYRPRVEKYLEDLFCGKRLSPLFPSSAEMSLYHFQTGGKRLRALIPLYVYKTLGKNPDDLLAFGAAVELIHNATLVHDDLQDGDEMRRGLPTVWKKYSEAQAINCGDSLFQYAQLAVMECLLPAENRLHLVHRMATATLAVIEGQAQEFLMKDEDFPSFERYLGVIRGKTSGLFGLPILGAVEAGAPQSWRSKDGTLNQELALAIQTCASELGVVFQIQDDLLDIYGDKGRDQKATDIAEGKISGLVALCYEHGSLSQKTTLREILRKSRRATSTEDIEIALSIFKEVDAKRFALEYIAEVLNRVQSDQVIQSVAPELASVFESLGKLFLKPISSIGGLPC